jgi:hypothetical protein
VMRYASAVMSDRREMTKLLAAAVLLFLALPSLAHAHVDWLRPNGTRAPVKGRDLPGRPLPDHLVIRPGRYEVGGRSFKLTRGAYRLDRQQRIVFDGTPRSLLSGISWFEYHDGTGPDNYLSPPEVANAMMHRRVAMICGQLAFFAIWLGADYGVEIRETGFAGSVNSRETEVKVNGAWQFYDLDGLFNFRPLVNGKPTNLLGFVRAKRSALSFDWLSSDAVKSSLADRPNPLFSRTAAEMARFHAQNSFGWPGIPAGVFPWEQYRRDITPMLRDGGYMYFFRQRDRQRIESEGNFLWMPRSEFMAKFYP